MEKNDYNGIRRPVGANRLAKPSDRAGPVVFEDYLLLKRCRFSIAAHP